MPRPFFLDVLARAAWVQLLQVLKAQERMPVFLSEAVGARHCDVGVLLLLAISFLTDCGASFFLYFGLESQTLAILPKIAKICKNGLINNCL